MKKAVSEGAHFNSHARVGRDRRRIIPCATPAISTHTPAWGATRFVLCHFVNSVNFNSHARVGRDDKQKEFIERVQSISTHTPAWGATLAMATALNSVGIDFNSHARVGRDPTRTTQQLCCPHFNSHARVGRDR